MPFLPVIAERRRTANRRAFATLIADAIVGNTPRILRSDTLSKALRCAVMIGIVDVGIHPTRRRRCNIASAWSSTSSKVNAPSPLLNLSYNCRWNWRHHNTEHAQTQGTGLNWVLNITTSRLFLPFFLYRFHTFRWQLQHLRRRHSVRREIGQLGHGSGGH